MERTSELSILKKLAIKIGENCSRLPDEPITGFMAMIGHEYNHELMVVGRAVNGWTQGWLPEALNTEMNQELFVNGILSSVQDGNPCPMTWVSNCWGNDRFDYNTARSAFWRVIKSVVMNLKVADINQPSWPSYLVWSNLYKVAPAEGGNPSNRLCKVQFDLCKTLLIEEIKIYKPRRILFLTGGWVSQFLEYMNPEHKTVSEMDYVEAAGTISIQKNCYSKCIIAAHPQGKNESKWVREVVQAFGILN